MLAKIIFVGITLIEFFELRFRTVPVEGRGSRRGLQVQTTFSQLQDHFQFFE